MGLILTLHRCLIRTGIARTNIKNHLNTSTISGKGKYINNYINLNHNYVYK